MQFIVSRVGSAGTRVIVPYFGDLLLNLGHAAVATVETYDEFFAVLIPSRRRSTGSLGSLFDLGLAHSTVTGYLKTLGNRLGHN
jgi:hypothetical protein